MLIRLAYWIYRTSNRLRIRVGRRLTPAGKLALAGLILCGAVGSNIEQSIGYQAIFLIGGLLSVSMFGAIFFRMSFSAERVLPRFGSVHEPMKYRVWVENGTDRAWSDLEYLDELDDPGPTFAQFRQTLHGGPHNRSLRLSAPLPPFQRAEVKPVPVPDLPAHGRAEFRFELTPARRGVLQFASACLCRRDALGLFRAMVRQSRPQSVLVLPRRYPLPRLKLPGNTRYQQGGVALASGIGESEEFVSLREYRRGDSLRRIHWPSWARSGKPIVKEYQDEFFVRHALVLDSFCAPHDDPLFEEAVSVASSFACTIPDQDSLLDLMFVGHQTVCLTAGRGVGHTEQLLEVLAVVQPSREPGFARLQRMVLKHAATLSGCVLVVIQWDEERRELVRKLKALNVPVHVILLRRPADPEVDPHAGVGPAPDRFTRLNLGEIEAGLRAL